MQADQQTLRVSIHTTAGEFQLAAAQVAAATSVKQGSTAHFVVFYDQGLANGPMLADAVLAACEADYDRLLGWFGNISIGNLPFNVYIQPGATGAFHIGCAGTALYCDDFNATDKEKDLVKSLVVMEADEVFMANQGAGWDCGGSNGEALSRILAAEIYPKEVTPLTLNVTFATARKWLESNRLDWVDSTEGTDRHFESIGCGALFINWLRFQLGYSLNQIVQAGAATLGATYQKLTGRQDGYARFSNLIAEYYPPGSSEHLGDQDNPFPLAQLWNSKMRLAVRRGAEIFYQQQFGDGIGVRTVYGEGNAENQYLVGDWTGDGKDKFAVRRGAEIFYQQHFGDGIGVRTVYGEGNAENQYLVGDWTGDGKDKFAVRRGSQIIYQQHFGDGIGVQITYGNGNAEDQYLVGDWNGDGKDKFAVRRGSYIIYQQHINDGIGVPLLYGNGNSENQYLVGQF